MKFGHFRVSGVSELLLLNSKWAIFSANFWEMLNKHFPAGTYAKTLGVVVINIDKCVLQSLRFNQESFWYCFNFQTLVAILDILFRVKWLFYLEDRTEPDRKFSLICVLKNKNFAIFNQSEYIMSHCFRIGIQITTKGGILFENNSEIISVALV